MGFFIDDSESSAPAASGGFFIDEPSLSDTANVGQKAASGFLGGIAGIGDLADIVQKYNPMSATFGRDVNPETSMGNLLRSGIKGATDIASDLQGREHIPEPTKIGTDSLAYKFGSYAPTALMSAPSLVGNGIVGALKAGAGIVGSNALTSGGGYVGQQLGGTPGEIIGAVTAGSLPAILSKGASSATSLFTPRPSEESSLLNAFKVSDEAATEALPVLKSLKDDGIVASTTSKTPYKDIADSLKSNISASEAAVQDALDNAGGVTIKDVLPSTDSFGKIKSGVEQKAISAAVKAEQEGLTMTGLQKLDDTTKSLLTSAENPSPTDLLSSYKKLARDALKDPASKEADIFSAVTQKIESTPLTASELRDLRISYDKNAKFESANNTPKSIAYKQFRTDLQDKILTLGGGPESELADTFSKYANQIEASKYVDPLVGAELKGEFVPQPIGKTIAQAAKAPFSKLTAGEQNAGYALKQLFGDTLAQKIISGQTAPQKILDSLSLKSGLLGIGASDLAPKTKEEKKTIIPIEQALTTIAKEKDMPKGQAPKGTDDTSISDTNKVAKSLISAIITQESGGKANAVSKENAYMKAAGTGTAKGKMQLLDATGKELFNKYKNDLPAKAKTDKYDPFNADQNVFLGTKYIEELLEHYDGDRELALTAYHSGIGTVDKLLKRNEGTTLADIIDDLGPVGQKYARSVLKKTNAFEV